MNYNSSPSNFESQNDDQPNESYNAWQEAMKDVEFQGNKPNISPEQDVAKDMENHEEIISENPDKKWENMTKISGRLGSNEGGWYERPSGERFYVKFYENPSQGQAEYVANAVYKKLGIKAVRSQIIELDGREAIASPAVPGAAPADVFSQKTSKDVQSGFVADAFLANWDVVGLVYDNIVQSDDGFYRIDNGGSLIFRAQGGDKAYSPDSIPELETMRVPGRPTGEVFANITEEEIGRQARELIDKLKPDDITAIVDESGLTGEDRDRVLTGLLGRREYLVKTYGEPEPNIEEETLNPESRERRPRRSVSETIRFLSSQEMERSGETAVRPRTEIICDHGHIEGQKIDVINKRDRGSMEFRFKLRTPSEITVPTIEGQDGQAEVTTPSGAILRRGKISYEGASTNNSYDLCDASVFEKNGVKVFVADPSSRNGETFSISSTHNDSNLIRTAIGLVQIEAPFSMSPEDTEKVLGDILEKDLGIPDALGEVSEDAEQEYKEARYKWQHVIPGELSPEQVERAERLEREEVFPGYSTLVEKGKHREYLEQYGEDIRAIHHLHTGGAKSIYRILTKGLMCTTERYSRGIIRNGMSSAVDMDTGGADSVFTRIMNESQRNSMHGATVVFKPEVFDRTDWYSYKGDTYGSTDNISFSSRLSPDAIFSKISNPNECISHTNEQMFRTGIGADYIESISVDPYEYNGVISELRSMGLEEIDGKPIEEIIVSRKSYSSSGFGFETFEVEPQSIGESSVSPDFETFEVELPSIGEYSVAPGFGTPEEIEKQKQIMAEKQANLQAMMSGEKPYTSIEEMIDLAYLGDDFSDTFKSLCESMIAQGKKEQLSSDMADYLKKVLGEDELKALISGEKVGGATDDEMAILPYIQDVLGVYRAIYKDVVSSKSAENPGLASSMREGQDISIPRSVPDD